jgi:uncharacterized membrane protein YgdD (TMEM256/DUF423 family)
MTGADAAHSTTVRVDHAWAWSAVAGLSGCLGVIMGALGAHAAASAELAKLAETGSYYQLLHAAVLLALAGRGNRWFQTARWLFVAGTVLFCGGLYLKALTGWAGATHAAPAGGISFIVGWLAIAAGGWASKPA